MTLIADDIERAAHAVRNANHATAHGPLDGPESYVVVGNLAELVHRLPQLLDFLVRSLRRAHAAEHYDDRGPGHEPGDTLTDAGHDLGQACAAIHDAARHLDAAHNDLGHLGRHLIKED